MPVFRVTPCRSGRDDNVDSMIPTTVGSVSETKDEIRCWDVDVEAQDENAIHYPRPVFTSLFVRDALAQQPMLRRTLCKPENCAIAVADLVDLHTQIDVEMHAYCAAHSLDEHFQHVCSAIQGECPFDHKGARFCTRLESHGQLRPLSPSMHTVVSRYVKPWTNPYELSYAATVIAHNRGRHIRETTVKSVLQTVNAGFTKVSSEGLIAEVFVSHNWQELFDDFVQTASGIANDETLLWICAFAINQNANIGEELGSCLEDVPFARALRAAQRVVVFMDSTALTLTRVWCVFELYLTYNEAKPIYVSLPDNSSGEAWTAVRRKLQSLDVRSCQASSANDLQMILQHIEGKEDELNNKVYDVVTRICQDAQTLAGCQSGDVEVVGNSSNPLCTDAKSRSSLQYACAAGSIDVLAVLLKRGATLEHEDFDGNSSIHFAAQSGSVETMEFLLNLRASVHIRNKLGLTPLHVAAKHGRVAFLHQAVALGADLRASTVERPVDWRGARWLDMSARTLHVGEPVHLAACHGHVDAVVQLARLRADVDSRAPGFSPLCAAAGNGHEAMVRALLQMAANLAVTCVEPGASPLHVAAKTGQSSTVEALLALRSDVNDVMTKGLLTGAQPLFVAAEAGHVEVTRLLLQRGANMHSTLTGALIRGVGAIHAAAVLGRVDVLSMLVRARCDIDAKVSRGMLVGATALVATCLLGLDDVAVLLCQLRADIEAKLEGRLLQGTTPLLAAAVNGHNDTVEALIARNANVEAKIAGGVLRGCTPLIAASFAGRTSSVQALLDGRANVDAELEGWSLCRGATALFAAIIRRRFHETTHALLRGGANVEAKIKACLIPSGARPLHAAILFFSRVETIQALLDANADVESRVTWLCLNARPTHEAALCGRGHVVEMLRGKGASLWPGVWGVLPPLLVASFTSIAFIIIAIILLFYLVTTDISVEMLVEHFPYADVGIILLCTCLVDLPRLPACLRITLLCCCARRKAEKKAATEHNDVA
eukprot:TRINITY_DN18523_c1_g1_i1.p1 TRINITY_DN18523_c1_g1~~TRINITY_DN18523_c1_g1_i1.p1  ORF type:complete len:1000 (+),score=95.95 TRINITY_DN18523_c1_g1_i1:43-3042(+)